jgi:hypothetical protein
VARLVRPTPCKRTQPQKRQRAGPEVPPSRHPRHDIAWQIGYSVELPLTRLIAATPVPEPPIHVVSFVRSVDATVTENVALVVAYRPLAVPPLAEKPVPPSDTVPGGKLTFVVTSEPFHVAVKAIVSLARFPANTEHELLEFLITLATPVGFGTACPALSVQLANFNGLIVTVSVVVVAGPGTSGGLKATLPVRLAHVTVPAPSVTDPPVTPIDDTEDGGPPVAHPERAAMLALKLALALTVDVANDPVTVPPVSENPDPDITAPLKVAIEVVTPLFHLIVNTNLVVGAFVMKAEQRLPPFRTDVAIGVVVSVPPVGAPGIEDVHDESVTLAILVVSSLAVPVAARGGVKVMLVGPRVQLMVPWIAAAAALPAPTSVTRPVVNSVAATAIAILCFMVNPPPPRPTGASTSLSGRASPEWE